MYNKMKVVPYLIQAQTAYPGQITQSVIFFLEQNNAFLLANEPEISVSPTSREKMFCLTQQFRP